MNSKDFIQALRKVIREEVQGAMRSELKEFSSLINEKTQNIVSYSDSIKPKIKQRAKQYTENPTLNELLNSTSGFSNNTTSYMDEQINYNDFSEWPSMQSKPMSMASPVITDIEGRKINTKQLASTPEGEAVVNALTRDYSQLMKAIDKKKSN